MKKQVCTLFLLCFATLFAAGCSKNAASPAGTPESAPVNSLTDGGSIETQAYIAAEDVVDVDLTALSSTMIYAEVYNMMTKPEDYRGKTIKMSGPYYASYYEETDQYYHFVIIEDAAACCAQGMEFLWNGEHVYPEDYPEEQAMIEITGVFGSYEELGQIYYYLAVDTIERL